MAGKVKNRGLGRGLDALFADQTPVVSTDAKEENDVPEENRVCYININDIKPNIDQPRKVFNEEKINELSNSIIEHGIIQPLVLRRKDGVYEIVAGERRWRAARKAGLKEVPCIIKEFSDEENMLIAIIENMQREDLSPIEEAEGLDRMIRVYGLTQEEVSKSVSKSRPYISNAIRLLNLPKDMQDLISEGKLTPGHGRAILSVKDDKLQKELCNRIIKENLSVRRAEEIAAKLTEKNRPNTKKAKDPETVRVEGQLKRIFGTKVSITERGKKGKIQLEFYNREELNRIIELLKSIEE